MKLSMFGVKALGTLHIKIVEISGIKYYVYCFQLKSFDSK